MEKHPERILHIPMSGPVRSLDLATAVGIALDDVLKRIHQHRNEAGAAE